MDDIWKTKYIKRLIEKGLNKDFASATYEAGCPHDEDSEAEDAGDDELSYWTDD